ncbi:unnamed protein product [Caenorhabditis auriculariae]|uniref:Phospholipase A2 n=1 Tax=Caenorhabditis auriculariae TaxID=2777116 RepID=A0A8S1HRZ2_9PELO|nr:unnamed protein product [Caenorhabditis auriculariae]
MQKLVVAVSFLASLSGVSAGQCSVLYQLEDMSLCQLQLPFSPYLNYGCVCSNIAPNKPVDNIDRCCQVHDTCYNKAIKSNVCKNKNAPFYCVYSWSCNRHKIVCKDSCPCLQQTCECDRKLIECLSKYSYPSHSRKCPASHHNIVATPWMVNVSEVEPPK